MLLSVFIGVHRWFKMFFPFISTASIRSVTRSQWNAEAHRDTRRICGLVVPKLISRQVGMPVALR